ncbi:MAG TPA: endolytic transglycosylase MltG [Candidatus Paceibacterota bacterium]|nr:endolytic transglycosylase MltG [Candidatus Paceibacterota bacterium]
MPNRIFTKKNIAVAIVIVIVITAAGLFFFSLDPVNATAGNNSPIVFQVGVGDGIREISQHLYAAHLIRSTVTFDLFSLLDGRAFELKPGLYRLSPSMDTPAIVAALSGSTAGKATVVIPEGSNIYDIDRILSNALVIRPGELINVASTQNLEGHLFPDTYQFYTDDNVGDVAQEMMNDFNAKAAPLLASDPANESRNLIIASIVEEEVPDQQDQEIVAGIILKRLEDGMPLDIDSTVCYAKLQADPTSTPQSCSLTALDFKIDSPYNTYLYKGLPPGPIGNPGTSAITAALHPQSSPYFYYLSDPATGKTIFAKTLDEQNQNRVKYLESN